MTSVINASAQGLIQAAWKADYIGEVYAGLEGINGLLDENLIDLSREDPRAIDALRYTPAGAFGSCRLKLKDMDKDRDAFQRIIDVLAAHDVGYFFYNGGNDSMDTVDKLGRFAATHGYDLQVIGVPKTIDNDLPVTDNCPGFGSAAKYNAISMMEGSLDVESMHRDSTKVFLLETMGRNAGWIAASTGLARRAERDGPHLILLPEVPFNPNRFLDAVDASVKSQGFCAITVSEGAQDESGRFVSESGELDAFGHPQLGGAGHFIQKLINRELKLKVHGAVLDYCQRSGRHLAAGVDVEQAIACGAEAVRLAGEGLSGRMVVIRRDGDDPYRWSLDHTDAGDIANKEKTMPPGFIREDGYHVTDAFRKYCLPLIQGEDYPPYKNGLPAYRRLNKELVAKKLPALG